jgi:hypothetical protein
MTASVLQETNNVLLTSGSSIPGGGSIAANMLYVLP